MGRRCSSARPQRSVALSERGRGLHRRRARADARGRREPISQAAGVGAGRPRRRRAPERAAFVAAYLAARLCGAVIVNVPWQWRREIVAVADETDAARRDARRSRRPEDDALGAASHPAPLAPQPTSLAAQAAEPLPRTADDRGLARVQLRNDGRVPRAPSTPRTTLALIAGRRSSSATASAPTTRSSSRPRSGTRSASSTACSSRCGPDAGWCCCRAGMRMRRGGARSSATAARSWPPRRRSSSTCVERRRGASRHTPFAYPAHLPLRRRPRAAPLLERARAAPPADRSRRRTTAPRSAAA